MSIELMIHRLGQSFPRLAPAITPETRLTDLGLDSLDTVEFLCVLNEEFGVRVTEEDFAPQQTIRGLLASAEERLVPLPG
jgi:acyl carrier protein